MCTFNNKGSSMALLVPDPDIHGNFPLDRRFFSFLKCSSYEEKKKDLLQTEKPKIVLSVSSL